jgi:signal transduction histidine kinase
VGKLKNIDQVRLMEIEQVLLEYCNGNFQPHVEITGDFDVYDSFGAAINMLGEELSATMVNRDYFHKIFNEIENVLFILDENGDVSDVNSTALIYFPGMHLKGLNIAEIIELNDDEIGEVLEKIRLIPGFRYDGEGTLVNVGSKTSVTVRINYLSAGNMTESYIVTINDISELKKRDHELVKAIVNTQEMERNRLAQDLHDDIGQQLSGLKMFMQALSAQKDDVQRSEVLKTCVELVDSISDEVRSVCFNLMPRTLDEMGLEKAIQLLVEKLQKGTEIDFRLVCFLDNTLISKEFEVNVFRIVQEFVNNSIKHADCNLVTISVIATDKNYEIGLTDNGRGFNKKKVENGMGLINIATRAKFVNGEVTWTTKKGKGVHLRITGQF